MSEIMLPLLGQYFYSHGAGADAGVVHLWCRCPVEVIHLPREELYHQPIATGSPPLLESEASESMKRYVCNFLVFFRKQKQPDSFINKLNLFI